MALLRQRSSGVGRSLGSKSSSSAAAPATAAVAPAAPSAPAVATSTNAAAAPAGGLAAAMASVGKPAERRETLENGRTQSRLAAVAASTVPVAPASMSAPRPPPAVAPPPPPPAFRPADGPGATSSLGGSSAHRAYDAATEALYAPGGGRSAGALTSGAWATDALRQRLRALSADGDGGPGDAAADVPRGGDDLAAGDGGDSGGAGGRVAPPAYQCSAARGCLCLEPGLVCGFRWRKHCEYETKRDAARLENEAKLRELGLLPPLPASAAAPAAEDAGAAAAAAEDDSDGADDELREAAWSITAPLEPSPPPAAAMPPPPPPAAASGAGVRKTAAAKRLSLIHI